MERNLYNELNGNSNGAFQESRMANNHANLGREKREKFRFYNSVLNEWRGIMDSSPVLLFTAIFIVAFFVDILVSWEMYRDIMSFVFPDPPFITTFLLGLLINGGAAVVAHYFSKQKSDDLFEWEVFNFIHLRPYGNTARELAERHVGKEKRKDFRYFIVGMGLLITVVGMISWQRSFLLSMGGNSAADYNLFQKMLPIIVVLIEVYTGIYLWFVIKRTVWARRRQKNYKDFRHHAQRCADFDLVSYSLYQRAKEAKEDFSVVKNLADSLYRIEYRSQNSDDYIDEINLNHTIFIVADRVTGAPISDAHLVGFWGESELTNAAYTNENGEAKVWWEGGIGILTGILIEGARFVGPFNNKSRHILRISPQAGTYPPMVNE